MEGVRGPCRFRGCGGEVPGVDGSAFVGRGGFGGKAGSGDENAGVPPSGETGIAVHGDDNSEPDNDAVGEAVAMAMDGVGALPTRCAVGDRTAGALEAEREGRGGTGGRSS